jgi:hypothetical protein
MSNGIVFASSIFFHFHDRLRSGRLTSDQFMNVLTLFGFQFSPEELLAIADRYEIIDGHTKHDRCRDFLDQSRCDSLARISCSESTG